jgi:hypothetical protein
LCADDLARDEALRALLQTPEAGDVYDAAYNRVHEALQLVPEVVTWAIVGRQSGDLDGTWRDSMVAHDARAVYRIHGAMLEPEAPTAAVTRIPLAEIVEVAVTTATRKDDYHGAVMAPSSRLSSTRPPGPSRVKSWPARLPRRSAGTVWSSPQGAQNNGVGPRTHAPS